MLLRRHPQGGHRGGGQRSYSDATVSPCGRLQGERRGSSHQQPVAATWSVIHPSIHQRCARNSRQPHSSALRCCGRADDDCCSLRLEADKWPQGRAGNSPLAEAQPASTRSSRLGALPGCNEVTDMVPPQLGTISCNKHFMSRLHCFGHSRTGPRQSSLSMRLPQPSLQDLHTSLPAATPSMRVGDTFISWSLDPLQSLCR